MNDTPLFLVFCVVLYFNQQSTTQKAKNREAFMNTDSVLSKALHSTEKLKQGAIYEYSFSNQ
jgi:hypothetical protein